MTTATPSLRRRVVTLGLTVVALVLVVVNAGVYFALRANLLNTLDAVLAERASTVLIEQTHVPAGDGAELARRMQARGLRVLVRTASGATFRSDPSSPVLSGTLPASSNDDGAYVSRTVALPDGSTAEVFARDGGVSQTLRKLLALQLLGSVGALGLAALLFSRASVLALRPVRAIAAAASRTAAGERGERLHPDRPDTELGQMATAYDDMLDALESGLQLAAKLERRSGTIEARLRQVLEAAQEAYVAVDRHGLVVDWNAEAEALFGWTREQIVGRHVGILIAPHMTEQVSSTLAAMVEQGPVQTSPTYQLQAVTRSGAEFIAETSIWGVERRGGAVVHVFVRDITARRRAEQNAARLAAFIEGSADAIVIQDLDGTIRSWNDAATRSYGWTAKEALGQGAGLFVPVAQQGAYDAMLDRVARGEPAAGFETEHLTRAGTLLPVSVRLAPVRNASGEVVAVSSIARDITEQRFLSSTLDTTLASLETALDEATASEERTRQFLADAAHQLRTPMAGIRACAETLLRGVPRESGDELLATMVRETSRAARLVTSLLQMARLDQGQPLVLVDDDVLAVCADEVERTRVLAPHLRVELVSEGPAVARTDVVALREALANVMDNARRHAKTQVQLHVDAADGAVRICVTDDGPGVPSERVGRIFERFVSDDGLGGSGLGLPIARGLARAMDGDLTYDDGFCLTLRAAAAAQASD